MSAYFLKCFLLAVMSIYRLVSHKKLFVSHSILIIVIMIIINIGVEWRRWIRYEWLLIQRNEVRVPRYMRQMPGKTRKTRVASCLWKEEKEESEEMRKLINRILLAVALSPLVPAIVTLFPWEASKPNCVGYYSVCSFAPYSSIILAGIAFATLGLVIATKRLLKRFLRLSDDLRWQDRKPIRENCFAAYKPQQTCTACPGTSGYYLATVRRTARSFKPRKDDPEAALLISQNGHNEHHGDMCRIGKEAAYRERTVLWRQASKHSLNNG